MNIVALTSQNQFHGTIQAIHRGSVVSEVEVHVDGGTVTSVITTGSLDALQLAVGDEVVALVKSSEVSVARLYERSAGYSPYLD